MSAQIGVTGLAVMGANLARNLARNGYTVALHNRSIEKTDSLLEKHGDDGDFIRTESLQELVDALEKPRRVLIMVKAGKPVDSVIDQLTPLLEPGDIVIDGGNSHYEDTRRREAALSKQDLHFVGVGVSGGEEGALLGPSIMPGGSRESYDSLGPMLEKISAKYDGEPCCRWIGTDGAGHFVKMVHNGIEYADMQVIGEAFDLLRSGAGIEPAEQAKIFTDWNSGTLSSFLIEITAEVLGHTDERTGKPFVDVVVDAAGQKGTGRWTVVSALELGSPTSGIAESVFARALSSQTDQRALAQEILQGHEGTVELPDTFVEDVRLALYASKLVSYAQGIDMLTAAAKEYGWELKLDEIASLWRAGCIIRAELLDDIMKAYAVADERPANLLLAPAFAEAIAGAVPAWRRVVATAVQLGIPVPVFSASLAYYDGLRRPRLPAALTQGLRDLFGAHTYNRVDTEGTFHTLWGEDKSEIEAVDTH
ncbi:NADP-dependent phosphogluconate dehydrogenase [Arthrobacter agilis]|uniref:NADP-dependent phosphogluconate dehydrogenase n=1 Tax=Arthrobacter agilis TaxID=37921 RepID=UPI000B3555EB|nr:NADP-dependent phosphogluconate dehydrogenase [Arthrobacter agilis]OUM44791.1 phosphogluconate dehydrogenase (NADP(+)-dependent, decarboxylating) [Arthrobacter agilis]PPB47115.1 NADP-dependent phosphogluconate dehydrogenase [Arthrobacter agilis]TPV22599.1 NADP-dependent phosphogluconate dehydrogenase [Arthrobacter agilis]